MISFWFNYTVAIACKDALFSVFIVLQPVCEGILLEHPVKQELARSLEVVLPFIPIYVKATKTIHVFYYIDVMLHFAHWGISSPYGITNGLDNWLWILYVCLHFKVHPVGNLVWFLAILYNKKKFCLARKNNGCGRPLRVQNQFYILLILMDLS